MSFRYVFDMPETTSMCGARCCSTDSILTWTNLYMYSGGQNNCDTKHPSACKASRNATRVVHLGLVHCGCEVLVDCAAPCEQHRPSKGSQVALLTKRPLAARCANGLRVPQRDPQACVNSLRLPHCMNDDRYHKVGMKPHTHMYECAYSFTSQLRPPSV